MKNYTFEQVQASLFKIGFFPENSFGNEIDGFMTSFVKPTETGGSEMANVDEWNDGSVTIDGMHPTVWYKEYSK